MNYSLSTQPDPNSVRQLLNACDLPTADLSDEQLARYHFVGCHDTSGQLLGVIGLEPYARVGLLRSLAVAQSARRLGCGRALVDALEDYARSIDIDQLYLLTTTASDFFQRLGYVITDRHVAPLAIAATDEFSDLCPDDAVFMSKLLAIS